VGGVAAWWGVVVTVMELERDLVIVAELEYYAARTPSCPIAGCAALVKGCTYMQREREGKSLLQNKIAVSGGSSTPPQAAIVWSVQYGSRLCNINVQISDGKGYAWDGACIAGKLMGIRSAMHNASPVSRL
jgi:hypothetical protein